MTETPITPSMLQGPALLQDVPSTTVPQFIRARALLHPEALAIVDAATSRSLTYGAFEHQVGRFAAGLSAHGFKAGDVMLMFAPNSPEWSVAAVGTMAAGGVVSGANPAYSAGDLAHQMRDCGAVFAFTTPALLATVREAAAACQCKHIIVLGQDGPWADALNYDDLLASILPEPEVEAKLDALAALPYSSGTTGLSKGVMLTHRTLLSNICQFSQAYEAPQNTVSLAFLPMFHIYGFTLIMLGGLAQGLKIITLPRFEPEAFLSAIATYRVTRVPVVPPVLQFLAMHPLVDSYDLTSLERISCGAAPLGAALEQLAAKRLNCPVVQGFGMTESSGCLALTNPAQVRPGSSGQLLPATQARVIHLETGLDVPVGETGEIWFRGPQAFTGYLNNAKATADTITADGWVRTGDIGYIDADNFIFITDRLKELIKVKGFQVAPAELEALLITHPLIADVAVISRADDRAGETPVAYVVPRTVSTQTPGQPPNADDFKQTVMTWLAERVVSYKQLGDVVMCDIIPKNPSGKILRRVLRAQDVERISR